MGGAEIRGRAKRLQGVAEWLGAWLRARAGPLSRVGVAERQGRGKPVVGVAESLAEL